MKKITFLIMLVGLIALGGSSFGGDYDVVNVPGQNPTVEEEQSADPDLTAKRKHSRGKTTRTKDKYDKWWDTLSLWQKERLIKEYEKGVQQQIKENLQNPPRWDKRELALK